MQHLFFKIWTTGNPHTHKALLYARDGTAGSGAMLLAKDKSQKLKQARIKFMKMLSSSDSDLTLAFAPTVVAMLHINFQIEIFIFLPLKIAQTTVPRECRRIARALRPGEQSYQERSVLDPWEGT